MGGILLQPLHKVKNHAMGQPGANHIGEAEYQHTHVVHIRKGGNNSFRSELCAAVIGDGFECHSLLTDFRTHLLSVNCRGGGKEQLLYTA